MLENMRVQKLREFWNKPGLFSLEYGIKVRYSAMNSIDVFLETFWNKFKLLLAKIVPKSAKWNCHVTWEPSKLCLKNTLEEQKFLQNPTQKLFRFSHDPVKKLWG